jgi:hypothetical protein
MLFPVAGMPFDSDRAVAADSGNLVVESDRVKRLKGPSHHNINKEHDR